MKFFIRQPIDSVRIQTRMKLTAVGIRRYPGRATFDNLLGAFYQPVERDRINRKYARQFGSFNDYGYTMPGRNATIGVKIKF